MRRRIDENVSGINGIDYLKRSGIFPLLFPFKKYTAKSVDKNGNACYNIGNLLKGDNIMSIFTERLSALLEKNNMTQRELAEVIGVTTATLSRYVSGDRLPKSDTVANIATALNTTSDYLLGNEKEGDFDFPKIQRLIARNASKMTVQEKKELINALFGDE